MTDNDTTRQGETPTSNLIGAEKCESASSSASRRRTRAEKFIIFGLGVLLSGCKPQSAPSASPGSSVTQVTATNDLLRTNSVSSITGTWHWRDDQMLIELSPDGRWRWWYLQEQSGRPSEQPYMSGSWFVHQQGLYLRIEQHLEGGGHGFGRGMAVVFDIKSVSPDALELRGFDEKDIKWKRIAEDSRATNATPQSLSTTNRASPMGDNR